MKQQEVLKFIAENMQDTNEPIKYMTYRGYIGTIEQDPYDVNLCGKVLLIRSLIHYKGDDLNALRDEFQSMIDDYIYDLTTTFGKMC